MMSRLIMNSIECGITQMKLSSKLLGHVQNSPCVQCVRCYRPRKPFWLPMAKSKLFRIPKKPVIPQEEIDELCRLYNVYRTQMKSLREFHKEQLMAQTTAPEVIAERKRKEREQHESCIKENVLWNAEVAKLRQERLAKENAEREEQIMKKIMEHDKKEKALIEQIDSHIRLEKEAAKSFITPNNIDAAIESALASVVDHNFCIDVEGNIYKGRYGKPDPKKPAESERKREVPDLAVASN